MATRALEGGVGDTFLSRSHSRDGSRGGEVKERFIGALCAVLCPFGLVMGGCGEEAEIAPPITAMNVSAAPGGCVAVVSVARGSEAHIRCGATSDGPEPAVAEIAPESHAAPIVPAPAEAIPGFSLATSSTWSGWPASNATDGNEETSWFSGSGDSAAHGRSPFFEMKFHSPRTVHRVTILGNRDPSWPRGFTILAGRLDAFDDVGSVLASKRQTGAGDKSDFTFDLGDLGGVKRVRFTSLKDEGDETGYGDVAISEFQVE